MTRVSCTGNNPRAFIESLARPVPCLNLAGGFNKGFFLEERMEVNINGYPVLIDDDDLSIVQRYRWYTMASKDNLIYFLSFYKQNGKRITVSLHREIANCQYNDGKYVDHKNGNTFDNRKGNLRICTMKENVRNRKLCRTSTTGFKSVTKVRGRYRARIGVDDKRIHLGYFDTPEQAHQAYCAAAKKYYGEYGRFE